MSLNSFPGKYDRRTDLMKFNFFDSVGAISIQGSTDLYFGSAEVLGDIVEIDPAETEIFKSQNGYAFAGVKKNPLGYKFSIYPKQDETFGKLREFLTAVTTPYRCKWSFIYNPLYDAGFNTFQNYSVIFDPCVIEVRNPEYRQNARGYGLVKDKPVELIVWKSLLPTVPSDNNVVNASGQAVTRVTTGSGLVVVKLTTG